MRDFYWDKVRGIAIVAVVAIHATAASQSFPRDSWNFWVGATLRQFVNFAVPIFLAVSGYFAGLNPIKRGFIEKRLARIIPSYLLFTLLYVIWLKRWDLVTPSALARDFLVGDGITIGYFVIVLVQMVLLTPLLDRIHSVEAHLAWMALGSLAGVSFTYAVQLELSGRWLAQFPYYALPFVVWYPLYHVGFLVARFNPAIYRHRMAIFLTWCLGISFCFIEARWLVAKGLHGFAISQLRFPNLLASVALFLLIASRSAEKAKTDDWIAWLGRNSFFIYLFHLIPLIVAGKALKRIPSLYNFQPLYILLLITLAVTTCAVAIFLAERVVPSGWRAKWLGLSTSMYRPVRPVEATTCQ